MKDKQGSASRFAAMLIALASLAQGSVLPGYAARSAARRATPGGTLSTHLNGRPDARVHKTGGSALATTLHMQQSGPSPDNHTTPPSGRIAFTSDRNGDFEIYTMNPDGSGQTRLTNDPAEDVQPAWSPDGARLAFVTNRDRDMEIYVMNADGTNPTRLTNSPGQDIEPTWSPDGTKIAFTSARDNTDEIYVMNADGSGQTNLSNNRAGDDVQPTWSPNGAMLAFASTRDGDKFQIYRMNANGSSPTRLTNNTADDTHPAWPPGRIAFQSNRDNDDEIYVLNALDGSGQTRLTNNAGFDVEPAQSSDGARFMFASDRDGNFEIYAANADGRNLTRLTNNAEANDIQPAVQSLTAGQVQSTLQFSAANYSVGENDRSVLITVTRTGDTTSGAAVDYAAMSGTASERSDFTTAMGVLRFGVGETAKSFPVFVSDDAFAEIAETVNLTLSNPTGATLGSPNTATLTITDNDLTPGATNPIDDATFFVRQHYLDFLNREPEADGLAAWLRVLNNCRAGDTTCDRVTVSSDFFLSPEFQSKGYFAIRFYLVAFGRVPTYREFVGDLSRLNGATGDEALANRATFTEEFTAREAFRGSYDGLANAAYVDRLVQTAGVAITNRDQLVSDLNAGRRTRGQVLRDIVESAPMNQSAFNRGFVASEYYGYLRRDPEPAGFQSWLDYLRTHPGDYRTMVNGFVNSIEYRARFGRP